MNRLLSKLRHAGRNEGTNGYGASRLRLAASNGRSSSRTGYVVTAAETAPCTCPDFCERDHENE